MVKKAKWLKNVKKAFGADLKKLKHQSLGCEDGEISYPVLIATSRSSPPQFEVRVDKVNYEENKNISPSSDPVTTTDEEDVPADSSPSSSESLHPALADRFPGKSEDEAASILIQTTFRGYLGRRKARAMRGLGRLELYMEGSVVQRQAANTLKSMHTLARLQSEIRSRRILMSEENQARHKQLLLKHAKELGGLKNGGNWNFSNQSREQVEASLLNKNEATMRRERGLAYAFTHQQNLKSGTKSANPMFIDPSNPAWGWSCSERWMAGGPWEGSDKEQNNNNKENSAVKNSTNRNSNGGETAKSSNRKKLSNSTQPNTRSPSPSPSSTSPVTTRKPRKNKPIPPSAKSKTSDEEDAKMNLRRPSSARSSASSDDERLTSSTTRRKVPTGSSSARAKSSERNRRPSSAPSSVSSDDERLTSSTTRRKVPTGSSARAKLKAQSSSTTTTEENGVVVPEKTPAKKRLSHSPSPAPKPRRSSAPPKVETGVLKVERTPVTD